MFDRDGRVLKNSKGILCQPDMNASNGITESELFEFAIDDVSRLLCFSMGGQYTKRDLSAMLVDAGSREVSMNQSSKDLEMMMVESNARYHMDKLRLWKLEDRTNLVLFERAKVILPDKPLKLGCDMVEIPYHGRPMKRKNEIRRGKAKLGTNRFHVYASFYVILHGRRVTICVKYVKAGDLLADVIAEMLKLVASENIRIECLFMDRGFYSVSVINLLKSKDVSFCMMAPIRGKTGGLRAICKGPTRTESYTVTTRKNGMTETASYTAYVVSKYEKGRHGKHERNYYIYATFKCPIPLSNVFDEYRKRFGIESSYRQMNDGRARTSTRDPRRRFLFVAIGFILLNLWVILKWQKISSPRMGPIGRVIHETLFPLETMLVMLTRVIGDVYCRIKEIVVEVI